MVMCATDFIYREIRFERDEMLENSCDGVLQRMQWARYRRYTWNNLSGWAGIRLPRLHAVALSELITCKGNY
jgi:hypothetical protein